MKTIFSLLFIFYFITFKTFNCKCIHYKEKLINASEIIKIKQYDNQPNVVVKTFVNKINNNLFYGRIAYINDAKSTLNVLQPGNDNNGCSKRQTDRTSSTSGLADNCEIAINAGFFSTTTNDCIGNLINNQTVYKNSGGIINAHFGIKKDGNLFFGYLSSDEVVSGNFDSLVGGVIWLVRGGESVVNESIHKECSDSQETGSLKLFAEIVSARTAVGATKNGTVVFVHVDGKSYEGGINLWDFALLLKKMGVVSAINLDGGGSATLVVNRTLVSYPSDACNLFTCERKVSTVLCIRARCPLNCPPQTQCSHGYCVSVSYWSKFNLMNMIIVVVLIVIVTIIFVLSIQWIINHYNKSSHKAPWSKYEARLVLNNDDDCIHFDAEPLLDDFDIIDPMK